MHNLIGNSCAASFIMVDKNKLNQQICNPFAYCIVDYNSIKYLIDNYEIINFNNYRLEPNKLHPDKFNIIIDNKVVIFYPHYIFDNTINFEENNVDHNIKSKNIKTYILNKYNERLLRMGDLEPIFILGSVQPGENYYTRRQIRDVLKSKNKYKIIVAQKEQILFINTKNREYIKLPNDILTNGVPLAKYIWEHSKILKSLK